MHGRVDITSTAGLLLLGVLLASLGAVIVFGQQTTAQVTAVQRRAASSEMGRYRASYQFYTQQGQLITSSYTSNQRPAEGSQFTVLYFPSIPQLVFRLSFSVPIISPLIGFFLIAVGGVLFVIGCVLLLTNSER